MGNRCHWLPAPFQLGADSDGFTDFREDAAHTDDQEQCLRWDDSCMASASSMALTDLTLQSPSSTPAPAGEAALHAAAGNAAGPVAAAYRLSLAGVGRQRPQQAERSARPSAGELTAPVLQAAALSAQVQSFLLLHSVGLADLGHVRKQVRFQSL